jgi:hypothetical protein
MLAEKTIKSRWVEAVTAMIALTQQGKLQWEALAAAKIPDADKIRTSAVFQTTHKDKRFRLYETLTETSNVNRILVTTFYGGETARWLRKVVLEIVNDEGLPLWTFPHTSALYDLLSAVQYQVTGADDFLDDILSEARVTVRSSQLRSLTVSERARKRGDALDEIIKVIDNDSLSESERLRKAKALAMNVLLEPEF